MHQIHHLNPPVVVEVALEDVAPGGADQAGVREVAEIVVDLFETAVFKVGDHRFHPPLRLAQKHAVRMFRRLLGVKHHSDAAHHHRFALGTEAVGQLERARRLAGQHAGDADQVATPAEIDRLDVFVVETHFHPFRQRGGEHRRADRREIELRLVRQLRPFRVDQLHFHFRYLISSNNCSRLAQSGYSGPAPGAKTRAAARSLPISIAIVSVSPHSFASSRVEAAPFT